MSDLTDLAERDLRFRFKVLLAGLALVSALCFLGVWAIGHHERDTRDTQALRDSVRILHANGVQLQVKFLHDTVRVRVADASARRWRDSVGALLDSLAAARGRRDTVRVAELTAGILEAVPHANAAADTAQQMCPLALRTCSEGWATARREAETATRLTIKLDADVAACERRGWLKAAAGAGVGYLARAATAR